MDNIGNKVRQYVRVLTYTALSVFAGAIAFLGFKHDGTTSDGSLIESAHADAPYGYSQGSYLGDGNDGDGDSDGDGDGDGGGDADGSGGNGSDGDSDGDGDGDG